jgi:anaerobic magnesium-protoporphyrin IX monomethyl ester cyclase
MHGTIKKVTRIMLAVMPYEGEVLDRVTDKFYKNKAVKYMPLGVLSLAANIPPEYEVNVLDAASRGFSLNETIEEIERWQPDILGLSVVTYRAWAMTEILRRTTAPIKVVGGPHATHNHDIIRLQGADAVFVDDAEESFPTWLKEGCPKGIFRGGQIPLDDLPLPARHLLDLDDYRIERNEEMLFDVGDLRLPMFSSKGCPFSCIYCDVQQKTFNFKSPKSCVEEFQELVRIGATSIHVLDDAFNVRKDRVSAMSQAIVKAGIDVDWSARGTVEVRELVIADLAAAGCQRLHVGIESLDDNILTYFKKSSRLKHIEKFCKLCEKYGITILAYFIIGTPLDTPEYLRDLPDRIDNLGIRLPYFNVLSALAETPYYEELRANGTFPTDHWAAFSANPVKDFVMPSVRTPDEDFQIRAQIDEYVTRFKRDEMPVFVA